MLTLISEDIRKILTTRSPDRAQSKLGCRGPMGNNGVTFGRRWGDDEATMGRRWGDDGATMGRRWGDDGATMG